MWEDALPGVVWFVTMRLSTVVSFLILGGGVEGEIGIG